jgi:glutamate N-acetyltransferase/amino-acid N-acetyltransferase
MNPVNPYESCKSCHHVFAFNWRWVKLEDKNFEFIKGGVTTAAGFLAGTACAAIKKADKRDVCGHIFLSSGVSRRVFTQNRVKAAPLLISMERLAAGSARAVVVNSGQRQCLQRGAGDEGRDGYGRRDGCCPWHSGKRGPGASTGVIGKKMPMDKVLPGVRAAAGRVSPDGGHLAAQAIMTTDTYSKEAAVQLETGGQESHNRGHGQGIGYDPPQHGDAALLYNHRCGGVCRLPEKSATARSRCQL